MSRKSVVAWLIIVLLVLPFLAYGLSSFIPQYDGFIVTSGSMAPEIQTGSLLFTLNVPAEKVGVGDTITFQEGETYTTHKVIEKNSSNGSFNFRTQGVANNSPDPGAVTEEELIGKVVFSIPLLGYFIAWSGTTLGLTVLVIVPGLLLILLEIKSLFSERPGD